MNQVFKYNKIVVYILLFFIGTYFLSGAKGNESGFFLFCFLAMLLGQALALIISIILLRFSYKIEIYFLSVLNISFIITSLFSIFSSLWIIAIVFFDILYFLNRYYIKEEYRILSNKE
ncbi:MAG: hypothetical protein WCJ59_03545 [bacterium]